MEESEEEVLKLKFVLLGDAGVGKSSLMHRLCVGQWKQETVTTIKINFDKYRLQRDGRAIQLNLWDTAGQEKYRSIAPVYYRDADAALVLYDVTRQDSLKSIQYWIKQLQDHLQQDDLVVAVLGNKIDCSDEKKKTQREDVLDLIGDFDRVFFDEISVKEGENLELIMNGIVDRALAVYKSKNEGEKKEKRISRKETQIDLRKPNTPAKKHSCCHH
mmetsp:Transcript_27212/g.37856  ORF Transcript_27212/g.37856 Transcript_27212/m.37856 type:complete len:216 (-) Transcript_27212:248-895(-)